MAAAYPDIVHASVPAGTDVLYFIEHSADESRQVITVRGSDNLEDALQDADYVREKDSGLGISVHKGFDDAARALYRDLLPHLRREYDVCVTGHSTGAAISTLLMMYLYQDGYQVREAINFGQPKFTNRAGAQAYPEIPLLRVVAADDVVPLLPAATPMNSFGGIYTHLGREVILLDGPDFIYLDQQEAMRKSRGSFWKQIGEEGIEAHSMDNYLRAIADKLDNSLQVPFSLREKAIAG
jgi:hypothetical protein